MYLKDIAALLAWHRLNAMLIHVSKDTGARKSRLPIEEHYHPALAHLEDSRMPWGPWVPGMELHRKGLLVFSDCSDGPLQGPAPSHCLPVNSGAVYPPTAFETGQSASTYMWCNIPLFGTAIPIARNMWDRKSSALHGKPMVQ
jgi:hypothetical protein